MTTIQIQEALITRYLRGPWSMHRATAQAAARKQLIAKGYTENEAQLIVKDAVDVAILQKNALVN